MTVKIETQEKLEEVKMMREKEEGKEGGVVGGDL